MKDDKIVKEFLSSFSCDKDKDIENFLRDKSITFEKSSKTRTYIALSNDFKILGYVSLALKSLEIPEDTSKSLRKSMDGLGNKEIASTPCYLIGQLARNSNVSKEIITGDDLMNFALSTIKGIQQVIGGRVVLIECKNENKLIKFYEKHQFKKLSQIPNGSTEMVQMVKII